MFRIVSSCSHDCSMEKEWAEAFDSSDLAHETSCNLSSQLNHLAVPLYHRQMHITFSFESRRHLGSHVQSSSTAGIHSKAKIKEHLRYIRGCCSNINMYQHVSTIYLTCLQNRIKWLDCIHHPTQSSAPSFAIRAPRTIFTTSTWAQRMGHIFHLPMFYPRRSHRPVRNGWRYVSRRRVKT